MPGRPSCLAQSALTLRSAGFFCTIPVYVTHPSTIDPGAFRPTTVPHSRKFDQLVDGEHLVVDGVLFLRPSTLGLLRVFFVYAFACESPTIIIIIIRLSDLCFFSSTLVAGDVFEEGAPPSYGRHRRAFPGQPGRCTRETSVFFGKTTGTGLVERLRP